jgi:MFS family permease
MDVKKKSGQGAIAVVLIAGIAAALHIGKLPPAIPVLRQALGVTLVEAGFLLSLVQLAGMLLGVVAGLLADGMGLRRCMMTGLALLGAASLAGGFAQDATALLVLRAVEGAGVLMAAMPGPGLIRRLAAPERMHASVSLWSAYIPVGTATSLLLMPLLIAAVGWSACWWLLAVVAWLAALLVWRALPVDGARAVDAHWLERLRLTLRSPGPNLLALTFGVYAAQWLVVIGFLPSVYAQAGIAARGAGVLTALVALVNIVGNIGSGHLLQHGVRARVVLGASFAVMLVTAIVTFIGHGDEVPFAVRYVAVLLFSAVGGAIPGALFALSARLAPGDGTVGTTVGWMQQGSSTGQVLWPPLAGWLAQQVGGWHWTWALTGVCAVTGIVLSWRIGRLLDQLHKA